MITNSRSRRSLLCGKACGKVKKVTSIPHPTWNQTVTRADVPTQIRAAVPFVPDTFSSPGVPRQWLRIVNTPQNSKELEAMRACIQRGRPLGSEHWAQTTAAEMGLTSSLRNRGRPKKGGKAC